MIISVLWALPIIISLSYAAKYSRHGTLLLRSIYHLIFGTIGGAIGLIIIYFLWSAPRPSDFVIYIALTLSFSIGIAVSTNYTHHFHIVFKMFWNILACLAFGTAVMVMFWVQALITTRQELSNEEVILSMVMLVICSSVLGVGVAISNEIGRIRTLKKHKLRLASGYGIPWPTKETPQKQDKKIPEKKKSAVKKNVTGQG